MSRCFWCGEPMVDLATADCCAPMRDKPSTLLKDCTVAEIAAKAKRHGLHIVMYCVEQRTKNRLPTESEYAAAQPGTLWLIEGELYGAGVNYVVVSGGEYPHMLVTLTRVKCRYVNAMGYPFAQWPGEKDTGTP